jgi:CBS domain-containing protein
MPKRVRDLIRKQELAVVPSAATVREAVKLMFERDFSQVPVIDERGDLAGIFTEQVFTRALYLNAAASGFLESSVREWMVTMTERVHLGDSIYDIMPKLARTYAAIVIQNDKPLGIVTDYDIAAFLAQWSEGIALVEDIETRLRAFIVRVFPTENAMEAALYHTFNKHLKPEDKRFRTYGKLSMWEHVLLIETDANWPHFEPYFKPKATFHHILEPVDDIRNQIAHFRGDLTPAQLKTLQAAASWLERRPHVPEPTPPQSAADEQ